MALKQALAPAQKGCPICHGEHAKLLFELGPDRVVKCSGCGMTYAISPPVDKNQLYNDGYFSGQATQGGYLDYESEYLSHSETFRRRVVNAEKRLGRKGLLLDYGCAYGHLGHVATQEGWQVIAADISHEAVHRAVHQYGLAGFVADLAHPPLKPGIFDLVTLYDIIEHVDQPKPILESVAELLRYDGLVHITTPDVGSLSAHALGRKWYHYKPQEHLLYFDRNTLREAMQLCGLETLEIASAPSHMTAHDVLLRLRRYSKPLAEVALGVLGVLGLKDMIVKIPIGEMQAWAKPRREPRRELLALPGGEQAAGASPVARLLPYLACPTCGHGNLNATTDETRLHCRGCGTDFEVRDQVPILLSPAKTQRAQKAA